MCGKIRTLILDANGFGWRPVLIDTLTQGILHIQGLGDLPKPLQKLPLFQRALKAHYDSLSYIVDWRDALYQSPTLDITLCNINNLIAYQHILKTIKEYELIIVLHSATGDDMTILQKSAKRFKERKGKLVVFIGNEYDLMAEKIDFVNSSQANFVCSQLPIQSARWIYSDCASIKVLAMPHALNPAIYAPPPASHKRSIDIGFRGAAYPLFIGDLERQTILNYFQDVGSSQNLNCNIRYEKLIRLEWRNFLYNCISIIGAESGSYYLDRGGQIISSAKKYLKTHPNISFEELHTLFFEALPKNVNTKCISSRHFEPIGTKTCQLLLEGKYNGILHADIHYISIKKDLSNIDDVIERLKDNKYRTQMVEKTYEYIMDVHTYQHRVNNLIKSVM